VDLGDHVVLANAVCADHGSKPQRRTLEQGRCPMGESAGEMSLENPGQHVAEHRQPFLGEMKSVCGALGDASARLAGPCGPASKEALRAVPAGQHWLPEFAGGQKSRPRWWRA